MLSDEPDIPRARTLSQAVLIEETITIKKIEQMKIREKSCPKTHNRSRSDLVDSILFTEKLAKYEEMKLQESIRVEEGAAPLAEQESMCAITSLNLENNGKAVDLDDLKHYHEQQMYEMEENVRSIQEGPVLKLPLGKHQLPEFRDFKSKQKQKIEKKMSLSNFFTKISRAVLKPRNGDVGQEVAKGKKEKAPRFGRRKLSSASSYDKENIMVGMAANFAAERRSGKREYKRLRTDKGYGMDLS